MKEIPYTTDPEDFVGTRCQEVESEFKCHRKLGHSSDTKTILKIDGEDGEKKEVIVEFNHRTQAGGRYFCW